MKVTWEEFIKGFEDRYTADQLWHMKWAWEVSASKNSGPLSEDELLKQIDLELQGKPRKGPEKGRDGFY